MKKQDMPDEIEPSIPSKEDLKRLMDQYKERDHAEAPSALWFFCGITAIILFVMIAFVMSSCQTIILDSDTDFLHYHENLENSDEIKSLTDITRTV